MSRSTVRGGNRLRRKLRRLPAVITAAVTDVIAKAAAEVHAEASRNMPVPGSHPYATGELQRKFRLFVSKDGLQARVGSWGKRRSRHIHLVEFGTAPHDIPMPDGGVIHHPGAPAQPFLLPAWQKARARFRVELRQAVGRALARESGGDAS
ncbi:hypothetical protein TSH58p_07205 [Azospirillum sp. TSH58]|uniref:HK97-gp10 family putative phage morphogenesis protein n=1 Tax=Azospirillum sp. TSH58 TaxID=664962 RepID=UPI000D5FFD08|nr:HK97-gp10 family putative phage morphogenesis protein [Azospirillum sp. TSH58]AWJ83333.1 hypothetical protein TSH58p_07205 [Azospirillum sp. TSH58]